MVDGHPGSAGTSPCKSPCNEVLERSTCGATVNPAVTVLKNCNLDGLPKISEEVQLAVDNASVPLQDYR